MNRGKHGRMTLSVVLVAVMALVLQGCGGDDNNGVEQDLRDQIAMLEGQLSGAETAKAAADAARMTAEAAATDAIAAQTAAEVERDAANTAKGAAEQAQTTAEAAQMTAEEAQTAAETAQMTAETAQAAAEKMQAASEAERDAAAGSLAAAEAARDAAKDAEAAAKVAQAQADAATMTAEADSADAMAAQATAEMAAADAMAAQATAEMAAADAMAAQATAEMAAADAMAAQAAAETERDAANAAKMAAMAAQAAAETERDAANAAKMAAEAAQAAAETAQAAAETAQKDAEDKANMYKDEVAKLRGDVSDTTEMDRSAAAKALLKALDPMEVPPDVTDVTDVINSGDLKKVIISSDGVLMAEIDDYTMADEAPDMIEGWRGAMFVGDDDTAAERNSVVVYSNIGDDKDTTLLDRYDSNRPTPTASRNYPVGATADTDDTVTIPWSVATRPDEKTALGGTATAPSVTFMGSVHGISGTFSCSGVADATTCTVPQRYSDDTVDAEGLDTEDMWVFTPDPAAAINTVDTDYLMFGWWLSKGIDGNPDAVALITSATGLGVMRNAAGDGDAVDGVLDLTAFVGTEGDDIRGSATYKGAAAGKYAIASGAADSYEGGHFTAMATLMADFDADDPDGSNALVDTDGVALSGMIDNFMTGSTARPDWSVKLMVDGDGMPTALNGDINLADGVANRDEMANTPLTSLVGDTTATMTTGWSTGAAAGGAGTWTAAWYGGVTAVGTTVTPGIPAAVTGTFSASIGTAAHLQGAFGAMKTDD